MSRSDNTFLVVDKNSEKYLKKLVGRRDFEDALRSLDKLTQEEVRMALAQVLRVTQNIQGVDDKVNVAIEGTFNMLATHTCHHKPIHD